MQVTITWHLALFVVAEAYFIYRLLSVDTRGDYNFGAGVEAMLWTSLIIIAALLYGGIAWW